MSLADRALSRRAALGLPVAAVATGLTVARPAAAAERPADVVAHWYDVVAAAIAAAGVPTTPVIDSRTWAIAWLAASRAALRVTSPVACTAAVSTALHDVLTAILPARAVVLDEELRASLSPLRDTPAKSAGVAAGRAEAAGALRERTGDGLDLASVNVAWSPPPVAPGVWRPTPPALTPGIQAGLGRARPFLLRHPAQFRPGPPPAVGSDRAVRDLAEVARIGAADSTERTQEQRETAQILAASALSALTQAVRGLARDSSRSVVHRACLLGAVHAASVDAQIACLEAKYTYVYWRPVTALQSVGDPGWTPLIPTPPHPEYPSGHACFAGNAAAMLHALAGPRPPEPFTLVNPFFPGLVSHPYTTWSQLARDNIDARVWSGVHFRTSDDVGAHLGRTTAAYALTHLDELFSSRSEGTPR